MGKVRPWAGGATDAIAIRIHSAMRSWWPWPGRRGCGAAGGFMTAPSSSPWSHVRCAPELWCRPAWDRWCSVPETPNGGPWGEPSTSPVTPVPITGWRWLQGFWNPEPAASWRRGSASVGNELPTSKGPIEHRLRPSPSGQSPNGEVPIGTSLGAQPTAAATGALGRKAGNSLAKRSRRRSTFSGVLL